MRKLNLLTRQEAIERVGKEAIEALDTIDVDFSMREMATDEIEFTSHHSLPEQEDGIDGVTAYYYQSKQVITDRVELEDMDWSDCAGYEFY